jgi:lipopolysaccharide export system protein LptA
MYLVRFVVRLAVLAGITGQVLAQDRALEVRSADVLSVRDVGGQQVQALIGNVFMVQPSVNGLVKLWCDSAFRNMQSNVAWLFGRVRVVRDSVTLTSTEGLYFGDERRAEMSKGVRLIRGRMNLTAQYGEYWTSERRAYFRGDVFVVDSASSTRSDFLTYYENEGKSVAVGNVRVDNPENDLTVLGDSLLYFERQRYTVVPRNPRLMQVDTLSSGLVDTLIVSGLYMEAFQDSVERFVAQGRVEMARSDFAARCGEATYIRGLGRIIMRHQPVVWHAENQVTGDSVVITTNRRKLDQVFVRGRSMAASRADTAYRTRFDQLSAREITLRFTNGKISQIDADRNATSLYYLFDGAQPNGVNRSSGDRIVMGFTDGKIDQIRVLGGVEGKYFPETMIANRENEYNLEGFRWITDRPIRRQLSIVRESYD